MFLVCTASNGVKDTLGVCPSSAPNLTAVDFASLFSSSLSQSDFDLAVAKTFAFLFGVFVVGYLVGIIAKMFSRS